MKLTKDQAETLKAKIDDPEAFHSFRDDLMEARLTALDPEFVKDLKAKSKNVPLWCA